MDNPMKQIMIEKVTLNIGAGEAGQKLENAKALLKMVSGKTPMVTTAKIRNPVFKIKKGDPIGAKVTLRGNDARALLERALEAVERAIPAHTFDKNGNFSFGIREYIDFPGVKYDPKIGIIGFDVCVTLARRGARTARRKRSASSVGKSQRITKEEGITFLQGMNVKVE